jgi:Mg/Co/Ni transporter MgtE
MSRLSATFSSFIVAYMLKEAGVTGVFGLITAAMLIAVIAMTLFGPNVRVIASAAKQSSLPPQRRSGLLRRKSSSQ